MYQVGLGLGGRRLVGSCDGAGSLEKTRVDAGSLLGLMSLSCRVEKQGHRFSSKRALVNYKLDFADTESIFIVFRLSHWCENSEPKFVKCPNSDLFVMYCGRVY